MWATLQKFTAERIEAEVEGFKAHSIGHGNSYADVDQAFKSWLIKSRQFGHKGGAPDKPKGGQVYIP